jgi:uncharacterized protein YgiB involved in biofilm formation
MRTMKRSKKAALVLMVPATTLLLAGCGEEREQALVYETPSECAAASFNTPEQCKADYDAAKALHPQVAPKYVSKEECETDFGSGNCETAPQQTASSGSFFMPMMMGYMMGQMMNRGGAAQNLQPGATSRVPTQPLYKSRDDLTTFRTATNAPVAKGIGPISLKPSQVQPQAGQVVRRGGFGAQAVKRAPATGFGG